MAKYARAFALLFLALVACQAAAKKESHHRKPHAPNPNAFKVVLTGAADKVKTKASGSIAGLIDEKTQTVSGVMTLKNIKDVNMCHIHIGATGVPGPVAAWLWPTDSKTPSAQPFSVGGCGWSVPFSIKAADIASNNATAHTVQITNFAELVSAIKSGNVYANCHTLKNAAGEVRGQFMKA